MPTARWNLKEAGCEEHTNSRANLWYDEQKPHKRLCMRVRLLNSENLNIGRFVNQLQFLHKGSQVIFRDRFKFCVNSKN
ncbi:hypothetical protein DW886_22400 [Enterocloster aldenensis]|nr:hypothetical protein DW886_22400 [Enterocloster aldenensis]